MNLRSSSSTLWARFILAYLVVAGAVPLFSSILSLGSIQAANTRRNFELAWGLMHMIPACAGICIALWHVQDLPIFSGVAVVCLTLQILFSLLDYRRIGFDPRMEIGLSVPEYLGGMILIGLPFLIMFLVSKRRKSRTTY